MFSAFSEDGRFTVTGNALNSSPVTFQECKSIRWSPSSSEDAAAAQKLMILLGGRRRSSEGDGITQYENIIYIVMVLYIYYQYSNSEKQEL